jgi:two-component system, NarL family, nitrate/nitrite response regulator NarL
VISIALIEDNRLVREGISALLNQTPDLNVVAAGPSGDPSLLRDVHPQVVLLDLGLRKRDSLRVAEQVTKEFPESKLIVMDLLPVHEDIVEFVGSAVSGFILPGATLEDLVSTIRSVAQGVPVLPRGRPEALDAVRMTPREREVVTSIAEGLSNKEIAARLHIATYTVRSHVRNVMEKLMLHTRLQIAAYAHRDGIS